MAGSPYEVKPEEMAPLKEPARERIRRFVQEALILSGGFEQDVATGITNAVIDQAQEEDLRLQERDRKGGFGPGASRIIGHAESAATCARATLLCPGGPDWWQAAGRRCLELLKQGKAVEAEVLQAEMLAGPSDLDMDFNWPASKLFGSASRLGVAPGRELIGGDGEGNRVRLRVVERDGVIGVEKIPGTGWNPTGDIWKQAYDDVHRLLTENSPNTP
jgi:hypothetical protein